MNNLIENAQIHILITFQATGLKLKLLNSLFAGRHTIINQLMVTGSGLQKICHIANTAEEIIRNQIDDFFAYIQNGEFKMYDSYNGIGRQKVRLYQTIITLTMEQTVMATLTCCLKLIIRHG